MPDPTFIPGYLATVLLNAEDFSAIGSVVRLQKSRNVMTKPTFGNPFGFSLGGQRLATFTANGHLSAEQAAALEAAYNATLPIAFSLQVGEGGEVTDAGLHTGSCVISQLTIEANADGEWDWSLDAQTSGAVVFTPAAGS